MGNAATQIEDYYYEVTLTPQQKLQRIVLNLKPKVKALDKLVDNCECDLEFLQKDVERAAKVGNRAQLTRHVESLVDTTRQRRRHKRNRALLQSFMNTVEDMQVSEAMHSSIDRIMELTTQLDMGDVKQIEEKMAQFTSMRDALATGNDMVRDALETSADEESQEDELVAAIVEDALQQSACALLDSMPVLGVHGRAQATAPVHKMSLDDMDKFITEGMRKK